MTTIIHNKPKCKYWDECYRKDANHKTQFLHPSDVAVESVNEEGGEVEGNVASPLALAKPNTKTPVKPQKRKTHDLSDSEGSQAMDVDGEQPASAKTASRALAFNPGKVETIGGANTASADNETPTKTAVTPGKRTIKECDAEDPGVSQKKQKTTHDSDDGKKEEAEESEMATDENEKASASGGQNVRRPKCMYWEGCYRKEKNHRAQYCHPGDKDECGTLDDGETADVQIDSKTYHIKRTGDVYSCSCVGWKTQKKAENMRSCIHLKDYLGEDTECKRCGLKKSEPNKGGAATIFRAARHKNVAVLLANRWSDSQDPTGWWISEKLDGVRAYWDGKSFYSRLGNEFIPPPSFIKNFPEEMTLDGELFSGRGEFQATVSIVKNAGSARWSEISFHIFDAPSLGKMAFEKRIEAITNYFAKHESKTVHVVEHTKCKGEPHLRAELERVQALGGEGLMIRKPKSLYEQRRSDTLLKIKTFYDAEAKVIGHEPGKGRNAGKTGALRCVMECGKEFSVGSGLSDKERNNPPKKGTIITYKFQEYTKSGSPRFPSYIGVRPDVDGPKDVILTNYAGKTKAE